MDSNSGSLQSSSGDEEYDSRAADSSPFSAFMNNPSAIATHIGAISNPLRPPSHHLHHNNNNNQITSSMFDPSSLSGYNFDPLSSRSLPNQNPLLNLDMLIWSKTLRSDPNCTDPPNILPSSSPSPPIQTRFRTSSSPVVPMPENVAVTVRPSSLASSEQTTSTCSGSGTGTAGVGVRNSKKRSRASRRAPTTVLTTDTTNFRAMVQEFTGIPAPPFSTSSSPFPRTRFDLFSSSSTIHPPSSSQPQPLPPPYLLRPFAQKIQPQQPQPLPFVSSSSSNATTNNNNTSTTTTTTAISTNMTTTNSTSINYQLPVVNSDLVHQVNTMHNNNNNNNPMLSFQSLLQTAPKYQLPNSINNTLGSSRPPNDDFALGNHGHVNPHLTASRRGDSNNSANWGGGDGVGSNNNEVGDHQGFLLRSVSGNNYGNPQQQQQQQPQRDTNGSNFNGDRGGGSENVSTRNEGMVESWLCSSD